MTPLEGIRVVDLTRLLPGPYATRVLAELGAEVIKVEEPAGGDYARWYPPLIGEPPTSALFHQLNRGKKSVALDLKRPAAVSALERLVAEADVLADSFRPGVLKRLGLDPDALLARHPRLIYVAVTGFGQTGPDAGRAGHDIGYMARAGALAMSGPAEAPVVPGVQVSDVGGALSAVSGVLAALFRRERTGKGGVVDVSLVEAALPFNVYNLGLLAGSGLPPRGQGTLDGSVPAYGVYPCADGFIAVGALEPKFWQAVLQVLAGEGFDVSGLEGAALDGGEAGRSARARLERIFRSQTRTAWTALFRKVDACVEPVLDPAEALEEAQLLFRGVADEDGFVSSSVRLRDSVEGASSSLGALVPAPALGAHTHEVLSAVGLSAAEIAAATES